MSQPSYSNADGYVGEQFFTLHMDVPLDAAHPPSAASFSVDINATGVTISGVTVDSAARTVTLTINSYILLPGDVIDFTYNDPTAGNDASAIQGVDGADAATFTNSIVVWGARPGPSAPPTPSLTSGSDSGVTGDGITNDNTPTVGGTAAANATVKLYDTNGTTLLGTTTADGAGNWSITSSTLADGSHSLKVTQTDSGNNTSPLSTGLTVKIDTAAAAPAGLALATGSDSGTLGDGITNATHPVIKGTAEANASVVVYDTNGTTAIGSATADGSGNWSVTSSALIEGTHSITAKQTDVAGNVSAVSGAFAVTVDTIGPTSMALSTTSAQQASATNGATVATLSSTDLTAVHYGFQVGNGAIDADNGKFTISGNSLVAAQNLTAGAYHIYLNATDAAGNAAYQIFTFNVVDAPSVTSIVRAGAGTVQASATSVDYTVTFDQAVTGVDASDFALTATGTAAGSIASITGSGTTYTVTVNGIAGDGTLRLDLKGSGTGIQNGSATGITGGYTGGQAFTLDHTAPAAPAAPQVGPGFDSGISPLDGISKWAMPIITGTAEANATLRLYDTDGTTLLATTTADGQGHWGVMSSTLSEGAHSLKVVQADAAGNVSTLSAGLNYEVDTIAPSAVTLSRSTLPIGQAGSGAPVATLSASDAHAVSYALVAGNSTNDADNGSFSISGNAIVAAQSLAAGIYHVHVQATDAAGNTSLQALSFEVIGAPAVTSIVRAAAAPSLAQASSTSVTYTVTFDQAVTGVDASDFALTSTGTAAGAIASVIGSGTTYTVTVDGIAGDGTLRLDLDASGTGIQNAGGTAVAGGYAAGQTYALDHTAPAAPSPVGLHPLDDTGVSNVDGYTSDNTPRLGGTVEANAIVTVYDTDGTTVVGTAQADGAGNWSLTSSSLADGVHQLSARQTDAAGNVSDASAVKTVTIATSATTPAAPALAAASDSGMAGDGITSATTPTIAGSATAFATVTLYDTDGTTVLGTATADATGKWSIASSHLADGMHALTVKQTDLAGNVSSASQPLNLKIDATAPGAPASPVLAAGSDTGAVGDNVTYVAAPVIKGSAEAGAHVTLFDSNGSTVLGTTTADGSGNWSLTSASLTLGAHHLTVVQTDAAGNASAASAALNLQIIEEPAPYIDGVQVATQTVVVPGGVIGSQVTVPIVTSGRIESSGSAGVADIPLSTYNGSTQLLAQVGTGFGLSATGAPSDSAGSSLEQLIKAIVASTPTHAAADQGHLTGNGHAFLDMLPSQVPLLVETVKPVTAAGASGATLALTGTSNAGQHTALVIDTSAVAAGNVVSLKSVDFAAVIGAGTVIGATSGQILTGDSAAQKFVVGTGLASSLFAGGGNDSMQLGTGSLVSGNADSQTHADQRGASATLMHGGQGVDTAVFTGAMSDYTIDKHEGHVVVTANGGAHDQAYVVNAEMLQFSDASVTVQNRASLSAIAGLYADTLGRQADVGGFEFWGNVEKSGTSLGAIALSFINSSEGQTHQQAFNGNAAHDIGILYQAIFSRTADAGGAAFWLDAMQHGASLEYVANEMMHSAEIVGHALGATQWDFLV